MLNDLGEPIPVDQPRRHSGSRIRFVLDQADQMQRVVQVGLLAFDEVEDQEIGQAPRQIVDVGQAAAPAGCDLPAQRADRVDRGHDAREHVGERERRIAIARRVRQGIDGGREIAGACRDARQRPAEGAGGNLVPERAKELGRLSGRLERAHRSEGEARLRQKRLKRVGHVFVRRLRLVSRIS
jgi:hypothetical protein